MAMSFHQANTKAGTDATAPNANSFTYSYAIFTEVEGHEYHARGSRGYKTGTISPIHRGGTRRGRSVTQHAAPIAARSFYRKVLR